MALMSSNLPTSLLVQAQTYAEASKADATKRAYALDWRHFTGWCARHGHEPLPAMPETIGGLYLTAHAQALSVATLQRRLPSISMAHKAKGYEFNGRQPAIALVLAGIKRMEGTAQRQVTALTTDLVA